jgi:hypothetical protein
MNKKKEKARKIYSCLKNIKLSSNIEPDDLGYKHAMIQANMILNDFVPSRDGIVEFE